MIDELEAIAATTEPAQPTIPEAEADETVDLNAVEEAQSPAATEETTEQTVEDDLEEFDWNGKKIQGPKGLKDSVLMHADYTRKTQEAAALRRELDERAQRIEQQSKVHQEELQIRVALSGIDQQMSQYQQMTAADWQRLQAEDPMGYDNARINLMQLRDAQRQLQGELSNRENHRTQEAQQGLAKRLEETRAYAEKEIKGWSPEVDQKLTQFVKEIGIPDDQVKSLMSPLFYKILHRAWIGEQTLNKPAAVKQAPSNIAPLKVVNSKANPPTSKPIHEMSMEEYVAFRDKQDAAAARR